MSSTLQAAGGHFGVSVQGFGALEGGLHALQLAGPERKVLPAPGVPGRRRLGPANLQILHHGLQVRSSPLMPQFTTFCALVALPVGIKTLISTFSSSPDADKMPSGCITHHTLCKFHCNVH